MGVWYGMARAQENIGRVENSKVFRILSVLVPVLLHGTYDYIAVVNMENGIGYFVLFIAVMFGLAFFMVRRVSRKDQYI